MPSRILETVLTGRNLLSPVLTTAAADVSAFDAKVAASQEKASVSAETSARAQKTAADQVVAANARTAASSSDAAAKVTAANTRVAESSSATSKKVVASQAKAAEATRGFAEVSESSAARSAVAWQSLATKGLPLIAVATALVTGKMAGDYQQLITKLETTAGESHKNLAMVSQGMLDMAGQVGISADELAKGMYTVESGGYHGADGLKVLKAAAQGARQENADLGKVTDAVSTVLHDYHLKASDAATVTSQLVTAVAHGKTTFDLLTGSLHSITPLASRVGISLADVTGTLAAMTASGMSADQATQNMENTLTHLVNPTSTMIAQLAQLGISTDDLSSSLSTRGLAGTLQMVEEAIVKHVDPATQRVLLPALNQSKAAAHDLQIMLGQMPEPLAKMSRGLLDGSVSLKDYTKGAKDLGGQAGPMALQFLSLYKSSDGFNNVLKAGGPAAQVFTAAMAKSFGTTAALNVALNTTGENAKATNAGIKDIAASTAQTDGSIRGWSEVQGNLNQKLAQAGAEAKSLAIEAGQHLLPVLSNIVGWVGSTGLPAIGHLGSGVGDLVHDFEQLPGPIKTVAEVLGGLALANAIGLFTALGTGIASVRFAMGVFAASTKASMGAVSASYAEAAAAARLSAAIQNESMASTAIAGAMAGTTAAAKTLAVQGFGALKAGASSLLNLLGGPWVVGTAAAALGVMAIVNSVKEHNAQVKADTASVTDWYKAMNQGGQTAIDAMNNVKNKQAELAAAQLHLNDLQAQTPSGARGGAGALANAVAIAKQKVQDLSGELVKGKKDADKYWNSLTPQGKIAATVAADEANLALALQNHAAGSKAVTDASVQYNADLAKQKQLSIALGQAEQTQIDKLNQLAASQLAGVSSSLAATQAQSQLSDAIGQYNTDAGDGQHSTKQLADESNSLAQQAISTAQAVGKATSDQMAANGVTDDGTAANAAMLKSLQDAAKHIRGPGHDALEQAITDLGKTTVATGNVHDAVGKMGVHIDKTWNDSTVIVGAMTAQQITDLHNLGYATKTLPNGKIVVTSDTKPATDEINRMLAYYRHQALTLQATLPSNGAIMGGGSARAAFAEGGLFRGAGTGTSDSNLIAVSDNEFIVNAAATQANLGLLHAINSGAIKGFASGGLTSGSTMGVGTSAIPTHMDTRGVGNQLAALIAHIRASLSFAPGAPANVSANAALAQSMAAGLGWTGGQWNAEYALGMRESGWRNTAQNPTSTAYGIPQFLNSTWATVGLSKTSDPRTQIIGMDRYISQRYGSPSAAWAHEMKFGWYQQGIDSVPNDGLAYLHKGERVVPAAQNTGFTAAAAPGYSTPISGGTTVMVAAPPPPQVTVHFHVDGQEFRGMTRTEIDHAFGQVHDLIHYAGG